MPQISDKAIQMPESPIRKLVPFAEGAKKRGVNVFHLNIGQPDIRTPEVVMEKIKNIDRTVIEYSHSAGYESYRNKLAAYYTKNNIPVSPEHIMITTGGSEALLFGMQVCLNPGDEVIIPEPFYANYNGFATSSGVNVKPITSRIEDGFALPPAKDFEKLITDKTKAIVICNPANPTGYVYSREELEVLRDLVKKYDLFLFADEVYREFCYGSTPFSVLNLEGIEENVIMIDSVSKRYSMCGARIGAIVSKNASLISNALKFGQARLSPPTLGQIAGEAALDTPQSYFDEVQVEYQKRRDIVVERLNNMEGVICPKPKGAFYAIAQLPVDNAEKFCQWLLEDFSHEGSTVMFAPAAGFYSTPGMGQKEIRIAYVLNETDLNKAMDCLEVALKVYKK
ncbi:MAG: pyridoxal phosphate-dependent aminotransferase [Flavobacteriales bacterium]|jgi:aspartate aminotransferase